MKKLIALCMAVILVLSMGALFGVSAEEAPSDKLSSGDNPFAAYLTVRENGKDHDARILLLANEAMLAEAETVTYTVSFTTASGNKAITDALGSNTTVYRKVTAAGAIYEAEEGYVFFGIVVTGIGYSGWSNLSVTIDNGTSEVTFSLDYADAIRKDNENLLGMTAKELYPVEDYNYLVAPLGMYYFADSSKLTNVEIHELSLPVSGCEVGDVLTVTVSRWAQFGNYAIGNVLGVDNITYELVAEEACEKGWVTFKDLSISCPYGYSIFVGAPTDTMELLYLYSTAEGVDPVYYNQHYCYQPADFYGYASQSYTAEVLTSATINIDYSGAPYIYSDMDRFSNSVVTSIDLPLRSAVKDTYFTIQVVKCDPATNTIAEVYSEHKLTIYQDVAYDWLSFDVDIYVPEGYTLAFGQPTDTATVLFEYVSRPEFNFYNKFGQYFDMTLAFRMYGYKCN